MADADGEAEHQDGEHRCGVDPTEPGVAMPARCVFGSHSDGHPEAEGEEGADSVQGTEDRVGHGSIVAWWRPGVVCSEGDREITPGG